jgi:hypothetical protein
MNVPFLPFSSVSTSTNNARLTRSACDIDGELFNLYSLANRAPAVTELGQPISAAIFTAAIHAQIAVLKGRLNTIQASERYEDEHLFILNAALNAAEWLHDDGSSPSAEWETLLA